MSVGYTAVQWNRNKKLYDLALLGLVLLGFGGYVLASLWQRPDLTAETLILRGTAVTGFLLLHLILCIGPLARIDRRFVVLLYNRRHAGVVTFLLAAVHAGVAITQFHALGDVNPIVSVFTAYAQDFRPFVDRAINLPNLPFEPLGFVALVILGLLAATSHDFWLKQLGASSWKLLHLAVLAAYGLLVAHVSYGALQSERSPLYVVVLGLGLTLVLALHLIAAFRERSRVPAERSVDADGFVPACRVTELIEGRGRSVHVGGRRAAVYLHRGRVYAISGVCRHQGGPLGEGRIIDGCVTCPWHGWQYRPEDGTSPPPFTETVETYAVRILDGEVRIAAEADAVGTAQAGAPVVEATR